MSMVLAPCAFCPRRKSASAAPKTRTISRAAVLEEALVFGRKHRVHHGLGGRSSKRTTRRFSRELSKRLVISSWLDFRGERAARRPIAVRCGKWCPLRNSPAVRWFPGNRSRSTAGSLPSNPSLLNSSRRSFHFAFLVSRAQQVSSQVSGAHGSHRYKCVQERKNTREVLW